MAMKILIAAGGTGGHIYPALAMADAFRAAYPESAIEFVGTADGLENKIIPPKGYKVHHLPIGRLNSNVKMSERVKTLLKMPFAFVKSVLILRRVKPDFVLGVGGHASGPLLLMASICGYRSAIWEPNAMPGMANRLLAKFVDDCWVVFDDAKKLLKNSHIHQAGMPVRAEIEGKAMPQRNGGGVFRILVFGGSQGARGISNAVLEMVKENPEWLNTVQIVHQTGSYDFERIREAYKELGSPARVDVREYLHDMPEQYAGADLVICRSGTGTLSELAACGKPAILIPLPTAADDHQRKNAESLVAKNAAVMLLQKDLNSKTLFQAIERLRKNPLSLALMSAAIRGFHSPKAAQTLVREFVERIEDAPR
jgi:UDP-N-acetylglucosamine--N-acetylmuramyl-(pentapeptide) pyrophosphoryl-undecaprenol N-acetylglucosamine transferase